MPQRQSFDRQRHSVLPKQFPQLCKVLLATDRMPLRFQPFQAYTFNFPQAGKSRTARLFRIDAV
jgi:hypothetical protein